MARVPSSKPPAQIGQTFQPSCRYMFVHQVLDGICAEPPAREAGEKELACEWPGFLHPSLQHTSSRFRKGCAALLPTFADTLDVRAGPKRNILTAKPSEFRQAQAGLHGNHKHGGIS